MRGARTLTLRKHLPYGLPDVSYDPVDTLSHALDGGGLGDLPLTAAPSHVEYAWLRRAIEGLQKKHGSSDADQIIANLERWRWLPKPFEDTYVVVNTADATLKYIHEGEVVLESRIVAGKATTPTPLFRTEITAVIVNPSWDVPGDIAMKEIMPKERRHPGFLAARHIVADRPEGALRQMPGPDNPLGNIMLDMPNRFDSYLHDTPNKNLFAKQDRHFSHGCMRVEQMESLASCILNGDPDSGKDQIHDAITEGETQRLSLPDAVPVYALYWTAVASESDGLSRHHDVYGWDKKVLDALRKDDRGESDQNPDCIPDYKNADLSTVGNN
jgi:murein L,D-transpeptidase YcbB/YkuD